MDEEYLALSRAVLALCREVVPAGATGAAISARALSTALAANIGASPDPGLILALVIRDFSEAALRGRRLKSLPPQRRRRQNVVDLAPRRGKRWDRNALDPESA